ncbi:MAG: GNAT family protein [Thermomicrobiales bacterium]
MSNAPSYPSLIPVPDVIKSDRIILRPLAPDDVPAFLAAIVESRPELDPWLEWPQHITTVDAARDLCLRRAAQRLLREDLMVGIFDRGDGRLLGGSGLHNPDWRVRSFEIGYWLRTSSVGRGVMQETVRLLTVLAFERLAARRVAIHCDPANTRSRRVAEAVGYMLEGRLRNDTVTPQGELRDTLVYALIPEDYARLAALWLPLITERPVTNGSELSVSFGAPTRPVGPELDSPGELV